MGLLRFVVWTGLCVALGVWMGTGRVAGKTPLQHAESAWKGHAPALDEVKKEAKELAGDVKKKVAAADGPKEQHTAEDRAAIDDIIARRPVKD